MNTELQNKIKEAKSNLFNISLRLQNNAGRCTCSECDKMRCWHLENISSIFDDILASKPRLIDPIELTKRLPEGTTVEVKNGGNPLLCGDAGAIYFPDHILENLLFINGKEIMSLYDFHSIVAEFYDKLAEKVKEIMGDEE